MLKVLLRFFVPCFLSFVINSSVAEPSKNNHGISGLINLPNAYFADAGNASMTIFRGEPDRKYSFTFSPTHWMEGGFYYSDLTGQEYGDGFKQSLKDKGFNVKFKLKEQGKLDRPIEVYITAPLLKPNYTQAWLNMLITIKRIIFK